MLEQLLKVKKHKERGIRGRIALLDYKQRELIQQQVALKNTRLKLWESWRQRCNESGILDYEKLVNFKAAMADLYRRDLQMGEETEQLNQQQQKLEKQRIELSSSLNKNRIEQEKLKYLLEDETNANSA
ncbi:hypothetical protein [Dongshaea marina]|uniref:hypothetical protein n=1 Tax=Dongshaea marina TaxID=2047966 RepID=UPI000D3E0E2D|nr:hypothetical protein [Dongshaea marina]